jgi:hypothetical protein
MNYGEYFDRAKAKNTATTAAAGCILYCCMENNMEMSEKFIVF